MNSREEKDGVLRAYPQGDLESPFLEEELFAEESETDWEVHLAALEAESPFRWAFEEEPGPAIEPELEDFGTSETEKGRIETDERYEAFDRPVQPLLGDSSEFEIIPPDDTRVYVRNTLAVPYRWICSLELYTENPTYPQGDKWLLRGKATGVLIQPSCVLTAAHNLRVTVGGEKRPVERIVVTPGRNGDKAPFGRAETRPDDWRTPNDWDPTNEVRTRMWDFAVIRLNEPLGNKSFKGERLGWWGSPEYGHGTSMKPLKLDWLKNRVVNGAGYPGDTCGTRVITDPDPKVVQRRINFCRHRTPELWASTQWRASGKVREVHREFLRHTIDTYRGQSGSPVWYYWPKEKKRWLVGLHVAPGDPGTDNVAIWIRQEVLDTIADLEAQLLQAGRRGGRGARELMGVLDEMAEEGPEILEELEAAERSEIEDYEEDELEVFEWEAEEATDEFEGAYEDKEPEDVEEEFDDFGAEGSDKEEIVEPLDITTEAEISEGEEEAFLDEYDEEDEYALFETATPPPLRVTKRPRSVPESDRVPFAPTPPHGSYWPIVTSHPKGREVNYLALDGKHVGSLQGRRFLAMRSEGKRYHVGIDLFANFNDPVVACQDGEIVNFYGFCCGTTKTSWALIVDHGTVVINYGEVAPDSLRRAGLKIGSQVRAGHLIGYIGKNPGGSSMLHFETYIPSTRKNGQWVVNRRRPPELLDPTEYLLFLAEFGLIGRVSRTTTTATPVVEPPPGVARPAAELVRFAQRVLNAAEGERLAVDGDLGRLTRGALDRFRRKYTGGVLDEKTELALAQRALEELKQQSLFGQLGVLDAATRQELIAFKSEHGLGTDATLDAATRTALTDALARRAVLPLVPAPVVGSGRNWAEVDRDQRMLYVMKLLVEKYQYPVNGAAGLVGNLRAESDVIPNRVEGSRATTPMRARDFNNILRDFTAEEVMNRNPTTEVGPLKAGIGIAQWTKRDRRAGLFQHTFQGERLGAAIIYNIDAQVDYLITELGSTYLRVDRVLKNPNVSLEDASDEVVYNFEIPGSILTKSKPRRKLPRTDPAVQNVFDMRRQYSRGALRAYRS